MKSIVSIAVVALSLCLGAGQAHAHHLWLEPTEQGFRLYFGEFGENLREVSPGALDRLQPQAKVVAPAGERPLTVDKTANAFVVAGKVDKADSVVAEDASFPVFVRNNDGVTTRSLYVPAARFVPDRAPRAALLPLDVVPVAGDKIRVVFKGKPFAKAKVEVITPSGWGRELFTGEDGEAALDLPWSGTYVIEVQHADKEPGKRGDEAYDLANYVTSLTIVQSQGLAPLPALPPAKPH
jgi:uncharacterized GH25 family protein